MRLWVISHHQQGFHPLVRLLRSSNSGCNKRWNTPTALPFTVNSMMLLPCVTAKILVSYSSSLWSKDVCCWSCFQKQQHKGILTLRVLSCLELSGFASVLVTVESNTVLSRKDILTTLSAFRVPFFKAHWNTNDYCIVQNQVSACINS